MLILTRFLLRNLSHLITKLTKWLWAKWRLRSAWASAQSDQPLLDQPGHPPSLIRVFTVYSMGSWGPQLSSCGQWRLIGLGGCPGWSESSLGAQSFGWFCHEAAHFKTTAIWLALHTLPNFLGFWYYRNDPKFSDRYAWANSADPYQTAPRGAVWSGSTLFAIPSALFGLITL